MPISAPITLALDVNGTPRQVLRFYHSNAGTLVLILDYPHIHPGEEYEDWTPDDLHLKHTHYAIHPSNHLPHENVIHFKQLTITGRKNEYVQYTEAIKSRRYFAPIAFVLYGATFPLSPAVKGNIISLGKCDPDVFSPMVCVFVGHSTCVFDHTSKDDFEIFQFVSGNFRIIIMLCYIIKLPAPMGMGATLRLETRRADTVKDPIARYLNSLLIRGLDEDECIKFFKEMRVFLLENFILRIKKYFPETNQDTPRWADLVRIAFLKYGRTDTPQFEHFQWRAVIRGLM